MWVCAAFALLATLSGLAISSRAAARSEAVVPVEELAAA
jgi:hypothetical protein